jgi:hypothetical protein
VKCQCQSKLLFVPCKLINIIIKHDITFIYLKSKYRMLRSCPEHHHNFSIATKLSYQLSNSDWCASDGTEKYANISNKYFFNIIVLRQSQIIWFLYIIKMIIFFFELLVKNMFTTRSFFKNFYIIISINKILSICNYTKSCKS